jgi:plastocyanin
MDRILKRMAAATVAALLLAFTAGCSKPVPEPAVRAEESGEVEVVLQNVRFAPESVTVKVGTRVTFVNRDPMVHDVVQISAKQVGKAAPGFASPPLAQDQRWSVTLDKPGTYPILCTQFAHYTAGMVGTITVVD